MLVSGLLLLAAAAGAVTDTVVIAGPETPADDAAVVAAFTRPGETARVVRAASARRQDDKSSLLSAAAAACRSGQDSALELKMQAARGAFQEGLSLYGRASESTADFSAMAACFIELGAAWLDDDEKKARQAFARAIVLCPKCAPDRRLHNPRVVASFEAAAYTLERSARGGLTVVAEPVGATVFLDGYEVGVAPVSLSELVPGVHVLQVASPGYRRFTEEVEISSATSTRRDVFLPLAQDDVAQIGDDPAAWVTLSARHRAPTVVVLLDHGARARAWRADRGASPVFEGDLAMLGKAVRDFLGDKVEASGPLTSPATITSPFVAVLPFGIGQFAQDETRTGTFFLASQLALLATNVVTGAVVYGDRRANGTVAHLERDRVLKVVNLATFGLLVADVILGGIHGASLAP